MTLRVLAEALLAARSPPDMVNLHLMDTLAAFYLGASIEEGNAIARFYGGRTERAERAVGAAAIARLSECDDIHLTSCITPGAVVIPVALALASEGSTEDFYRAISAGYAAGLRLGIAIGGAKALGSGTWPTLLAAPLMAAVTASVSRGYDPDRLAHAMALALAGASGRIGRPSPSSGRWFLFAEAVLRGLRACDVAGQGFRGDVSLLSKAWLAAAAGHDEIDVAALEPSGPAASISDVDFKPFPIARQAANAIFAFQRLLQAGLDPRRIDTIDVLVPDMNVSLLSRPATLDDRLSRLCNMGYQLACAAFAPEMLDDTARTLTSDTPVTDFVTRVSVKSSAELNAHLPSRWAAKVAVVAGRDRFEETVVRTPLDHDAPDLERALYGKWRRLLSEGDAHDLFRNTSGTVQPEALWQMIDQRVSISPDNARNPGSGLRAQRPTKI